MYSHSPPWAEWKPPGIEREIMEHRKLKHSEWIEEAQTRFGLDAMGWKFVCPSCGHVASVRDWKDAGAPQGAVAFSCIGRYTGDQKKAADAAFKRSGGPCNYTGGGLIGINPVTVIFEDGKSADYFEFAP